MELVLLVLSLLLVLPSSPSSSVQVGWASVIGLEVYALVMSKTWKIGWGSMGLTLLLLSSFVWVDTLISCGTFLVVFNPGILLVKSLIGFSTAATRAPKDDDVSAILSSVLALAIVSVLASAIRLNGFAVVNWRMGVGVPLSDVTVVGDSSPVPCWRVSIHSSSMQFLVCC